jgi:hypothetical protein
MKDGRFSPAQMLSFCPRFHRLVAIINRIAANAAPGNTPPA